MAEACKEAGMDSELVELIRTSDCLLRDTDWFRSTRGNSSDLVDSHSDTSPDSSSSTISSDHRSFLMDALDVQNLYSLVIGALMEWHLSHSEDAGDSAASPVEHVVALCTAMVLIYAALGQHASLGPLPKGTLRLRRYLNSRTRTSLGRAGTSATAHLPTPPSSVTSPTPSHTLLTAGSSGIAVHDVSLALRPPPRSCPYPDQRSPSLSRRTASPSTPQHHDTDGNPQRLPIFTALSDIGLDVWAAVVVSMAAAGQPDEASYFRPALAATLAASLPESLHKSRDGWLALRAKLRNGDVIWGPEPLDAYAKQLWWAVMEEGGGGCEGPGGLNTGRHSDGKTTDDETMNPRQPQVAQQQTAIRSPTTQLVPLNPYTSACLVGLSNNRAVNLLK